MTFDVVCLGILVADVIARPVDELPPAGSLRLVESISLRGGGCALNTATASMRLGLSAAVAGKLGADRLGDFLLHLLDERGIDRRGVVRDSTTPTSATIVLVAPGGERTFLHFTGANAQLRSDELDTDLLLSGRVLHAAGALVMDRLDGEPLAGLLAEAKRRGVTTCLDTVWDATDLTYVLRGTIILGGAYDFFGRTSSPPVPNLTAYGAIPKPSLSLTIQSALPGTPLADGIRIHCPDADNELWQSVGTGDARAGHPVDVGVPQITARVRQRSMSGFEMPGLMATAAVARLPGGRVALRPERPQRLVSRPTDRIPTTAGAWRT